MLRVGAQLPVDCGRISSTSLPCGIVSQRHRGRSKKSSGAFGSQKSASLVHLVGVSAVSTDDRSTASATEDDPARTISQLKTENETLKAQIEQLRKRLDPQEGVSLDESVDHGVTESAATPEATTTTEETPTEDSETSSQESLPLESLADGIQWPTASESAAWERPARSQPWKGVKRKKPEIKKDKRLLKIVHISAELAPYAKVGGLGDVVAGLSRACLERGHDIEVILPFYQSLPEEKLEDLQHVMDFDVPKGSFHDGNMHHGVLRTSAFRCTIDGIHVLLLKPDWNCTNLFKGDRIYGGSYNETEAYLYFSRASLEFVKVSGQQPDVLHVHEWQTAAVPMLFWENYQPHGLQDCRVILTIHNLDSQGECRQDEFAVTGMNGQAFADVNKALDERTIGHNPERLCLMKGGIVYSNKVTTVSPTYALEALEGGAAGWLKSTFVRPDVREKFSGVLNGIDASAWDPATDTILPAPFEHDKLEGKQLCKRFLQKALHLDEAADKPLVAVITRLVPQKGIHLIHHAAYRTLEQGGQFVLLGTGHADGDFRRMQEQDLKDHQDARVLLMYSDKLAHLIYAAADIVLVPSLFEPCGLTQLVGMRYGAVPVVRRTGGLADTVKDVSEGEHGNGYAFDGTDAGSLNSALDRAFAAYKDDKAQWSSLVADNMRRDCSWQSSAGQYLEMYYEELD